MMRRIREWLGIEPAPDAGRLIREGAQVVDVRSRQEYAAGHLKGSVNIPLPELAGSIGKIRKKQPVVVCCASGMRSATAKGLLRDLGYDAHNGGGWRSLQNKLK